MNDNAATVGVTWGICAAFAATMFFVTSCEKQNSHENEVTKRETIKQIAECHKLHAQLNPAEIKLLCGAEQD